jgi:hypothetical protein
LLLPLDKEARKEMIRKFLENAPGSLHPDRIDETKLSDLASASFFLGYKDIEAAISRVRRSDKRTIANLEGELKHCGRTTTLRFYKKAFSEIDVDREAVEREFLPLVHMAARDAGADKNTALDRESVDALFPLLQNEKPVYANAEELRAKAQEFVDRQNGPGAIP